MRSRLQQQPESRNAPFKENRSLVMHKCDEPFFRQPATSPPFGAPYYPAALSTLKGANGAVIPTSVPITATATAIRAIVKLDVDL